MPSERRTFTRVSPTISHTASAPNTVRRGATGALGREAAVDRDRRAAFEAQPRRDAVFGGALVQVTLVVGPLAHVDARLGVDRDDLAEAPPDRVDRVRAPRADPPATSLAVEEPAVAPHAARGSRR